MFCPNCKAEYRPGFTVCADCHIPLVAELPQESEELPNDAGDVHFVPVLSTFNNGDIAVIKSLLDEGDINYHFQGENFHYIRPAVEPAILMVQSDQVEIVRELLKDLDIRFVLFGPQS